MKLFLKVILSLILFLIISEIALTVYFSIKDSKYHPIPTADYPYTYFVQDDANHDNPHQLKTDYNYLKSPDVYRIYLSGGSVVRSGTTGQTIADYLEIFLNEHSPEKRFEVVNAGVSAFVLQQEFIFFHTTGIRFQPDMVVCLSGYNDLLTWYYNRFENNHELIYPHHWSNFKAVERTAQKHTLKSRFNGLFPAIDRAVNFYTKTRLERNFDWENTSNTFDSFAKNYSKIITDFEAYTSGKEENIDYINVFQPVRFMTGKHFADNNYRKYLNKLYQKMIDEASEHDANVYDFSTVFSEDLNIFTDDCHLNLEGNRLVAQLLSKIILAKVSKQTSKTRSH